MRRATLFTSLLGLFAGAKLLPSVNKIDPPACSPPEKYTHKAYSREFIVIREDLTVANLERACNRLAEHLRRTKEKLAADVISRQFYHWR